MADIFNSKSNTLVSGTSGNDSIQNGGYWSGYEHKSGSNVTISGGAGNDSIRNYDGSKVTIDGGTGNDLIGNSSSNVKIDGCAGNDSIENGSSSSSSYDLYNVTISGGAGNDIIRNWCSEVTIDGGKGNDSITNSGSATINAGAGKDFISLNSSGNVIKYASGDGNDTICGFNLDDTLQITSDSYSVKPIGSDLIVKVGKNKITIKFDENGKKINIEDSSGNVVTYNDDGTIWNGIIVGTVENDTIKNIGDNVSINAGAGNDSIENYGSNVTIDGGKGNDNIYSRGDNAVIKYASSDGNDTIYGLNSRDTLQITSGSYSVETVDSGLVVKVGKNKVTINFDDGDDYDEDDDEENYNKINIKDSSGNVVTYSDDGTVWKGIIKYNTDSDVTVVGTVENDIIENTGNNVLINGNAGNDVIANEAEKVTINAGAGNDSIKNHSGSNVTINGGTGDDTIQSFGGKVNAGDYVSVSGGKGNDFISNGNENGDSDYDEKDLEYGGDNVTIDGGTGNDTIQNFGGKYASIFGGSGNDSIHNGYCSYYSGVTGGGDNVKIDAGVGNDTIQNDCKYATITGGAGNDSINLSYHIWKDYIDDWGDTYTEYREAKNVLIQYASGDGEDTVVGFNATDTLQITKGSYKVKTSGNDVVVTVGKGKILLKDAVGKKISIKNSKGKVTTKNYGSSSSNVAELFAENNFTTTDNISEIVAEKAVGEFESFSNEKSAQENLITFAK